MQRCSPSAVCELCVTEEHFDVMNNITETVYSTNIISHRKFWPCTQGIRINSVEWFSVIGQSAAWDNHDCHLFSSSPCCLDIHKKQLASGEVNIKLLSLPARKLWLGAQAELVPAAFALFTRINRKYLRLNPTAGGGLYLKRVAVTLYETQWQHSGP